MNVKRFLLTAALIAAVTSFVYGGVPSWSLGALANAGSSSTEVNMTGPDLVPKPATMAVLGMVLMCLFNWHNRSGGE